MEKRVYDRWAGNPKGRAENVTLCIESVRDSMGWHWYQCSRKRGHGPNRLFCKQHGRMAEHKLDHYGPVWFRDYYKIGLDEPFLTPAPGQVQK